MVGIGDGEILFRGSRKEVDLDDDLGRLVVSRSADDEDRTRPCCANWRMSRRWVRLDEERISMIRFLVEAINSMDPSSTCSGKGTSSIIFAWGGQKAATVKSLWGPLLDGRTAPHLTPET